MGSAGAPVSELIFRTRNEEGKIKWGGKIEMNRKELEKRKELRTEENKMS
jgi:hypothetical protein